MDRVQVKLLPSHLFKFQVSPKTSPQAACFQNSRCAASRSRVVPASICLLARLNPLLNATPVDPISGGIPVTLQETIEMISPGFGCGNLVKILIPHCIKICLLAPSGALLCILVYKIPATTFSDFSDFELPIYIHYSLLF